MSVHMLHAETDSSQLAADRRMARIRLCATTPRDTRSAGIGMLDEPAQRRVDGWFAVLCLLAIPVAAYALFHAI